MKKTMLTLLAGFFAIQLLTLGYQVYTHYDTLSNGELFRFAVLPYDPYDPFRGRYVALRAEQDIYNEKPYALLSRDEEGNALVAAWADARPQGVPYAKNLRLDRYYMNEKLAPEAERVSRTLSDDDRLTLLVRVNNGRYVIEGLTLNNIPIEQYLTQQPEAAPPTERKQ